MGKREGTLTELVPPSTFDKSKKMWSKQEQVPLLPLQSLDYTLSVYLKSIEPFCTTTELQIVSRLAADFANSADGKKLQALLQERRKNETTSWLARWWNDWAYMSYRDPVVIWVSYFFGYKPDPARQTQTRRAAGLIAAAIDVRNQIENATLEPEMAGNKPVDMSQYPIVVGTTRVPKPNSDVLAKYDEIDSRHILVCRRNRFYVFNAIDSKGAILTPGQIETLLLNIIAMADKSGDAEVPLGVLTADNRDDWSRVYQMLINISPSNAAALEKLQSAMFAICLDSVEPQLPNEVSRWLWHSDLKNRWFDKSFQLAVSPSGGKAGYIGEHSGADGSPGLYVSEKIIDICKKTKAHSAPENVPASFGVASELIFTITPELKKEVARAEESGKRLIESASMNVLNYTKFGKNFIKKGSVSPDAFMQMAIQYGYYKMYGKFAATYESAMTRTFLFGRTETIRSCSSASAAFCRGMENPTLSPLAKYRLFKSACDQHVNYVKIAGDAAGCDRHLLGLRLIASENKIPLHPFFTDPVRERTSTWRLSTSQLSSENFDAYGWGAVHFDGYGIPYSIMNDSLRFTVANFNSGFHTNVFKFCQNISDAIDEMAEVINAGAADNAFNAPKAKL